MVRHDDITIYTGIAVYRRNPLNQCLQHLTGLGQYTGELLLKAGHLLGEWPDPAAGWKPWLAPHRGIIVKDWMLNAAPKMICVS